MTTIVTRTGKGSPLTHVEVDTNFTNLNTAKLEAGAIALGSAAAPSISFTGDTNTGIFSPGADTLAFAEGGVEAMRIDSSGRVGIGSTVPDTALHINGTFDSSSAFATTSSNKGLTINSSLADPTGVQYGVVFSSSQGTNFDYPVAGIMAIPVTPSTGIGGSLSFQTHTSADTTLAERARIDSSGRLLVGTSTANTSGAKLQTVDGLTFPATQVASADANTLDDYEEGTFTPGISFGGGTAGISYTGGLVGTYVKIGRVVYVTVAVQAQSNGTSTGNLAITGLPFTAANTTGVFGLSGYGILAVSRDNGTNVITATSFSSSISSGATTIACFKTVSAITAPAANITDVDCGTLGNNYTASIYYYV